MRVQVRLQRIVAFGLLIGCVGLKPSVGREKQECRRRAVRPTSGVIQCRLRKSYIDEETGERMCIYQRGATGQGDMTTSMSKEFSCERSISCNQE